MIFAILRTHTFIHTQVGPRREEGVFVCRAIDHIFSRGIINLHALTWPAGVARTHVTEQSNVRARPLLPSSFSDRVLLISLSFTVPSFEKLRITT